MDKRETIKALASGGLSFADYADQALSVQLTDLTVDVGRTCSLKCAGMCYRTDRARPTRAEEYVPIECLVEEVRAAEARGLTNLTISGTEPFLHIDGEEESSHLAVQRTFDILRQLGTRPRAYRLGLVSNGLDIHRHWDHLVAEVEQGHLDYLDLSIDSGDPFVHDRIRGRKGAGDAALTALREANRRLGGVRVSTSSVLRPDNADGILRLVEGQAFHNRNFFITPIQPLSVGKGVQPVKPEMLVQFVWRLEELLRQRNVSESGVEVTLLVTGLYIYDLMQAGIFSWDEVSEDLSVTRQIHGSTLRFQLVVVPEYGLNLGLLEFTGDFLPHAHALQLPYEERGEWVVGSIRNTSLHELHQRGVRGIIQQLIRARTNHDCRDQPCWSTCFGGMAFNMEDAALSRALLTAKPGACVRSGSRKLPVVP